MSKKLKIILDSSSGLNKKETEKLGFGFIPIIVDFEGKEYEAGINMDDKFLYENMNKNTKVKTAAVRLGDMEKILTEASENYDEVLMIPLSKNLSSIHSSATVVAKKFKNVEIYDSELITPWLNINLPEIKKLADKNDKDGIIKLLDSMKGSMQGYLMPANMESLYAGGRISKAQYLIGSLIKISPIIPVINGAINQQGVVKAKGFAKAIEKAAEMLKKNVEAEAKKGKHIKIFVADLNNKEGNAIAQNMLKDIGLTQYEIVVSKLSAEIIAHVGPGAVSFGVIATTK